MARAAPAGPTPRPRRSWAGRRLQGSLAGRHSEVEGWREHSAWQGDHLQTVLRTNAGAGTALALHALGLRSDRERPGPIPLDAPPRSAGTPLDRERAHTAQLGLSLSRPLAGVAEIESFVRLRDKRQRIVETLVGESLGHDVESGALGGEVRARFPLPKSGRLLAGAEAERGDLTGTYREVDLSGEPGDRLDRARVHRTTLAGFASAEVDLSKRLTLSAGLRHDRLRGDLDLQGPELPASTDLSATSPRLALNWRWSSATNAFLAAGRSFKAPTLEQLFDRRPFHVAPDLPPLLLSNSSLQPQRARHLEAGLRAGRGRLRTELSLYSLQVEDEIGFDLASLRFANIDKSDHRGGEGSLTASLPADLDLRLAYTLSLATFRGGPFDSSQINGVPRRQAAAALAWRADSTGPRATLEAWHRRGQYLDEANRHPLDPATVLDLLLGYRFRRLTLDLTARNLLQARYDADGFVSLDAAGAPLPLVLPGSKRSLVARLRLDL